MNLSNKKTRGIILAIWAVLAVTALSLFFLKRELLLVWVAGIAGLPLLWLGAAYLLLGCLRGLTLIPVTGLIVLGMVFLPPWHAYILTLAGVLVSSTFVYYFSEYLGMADYFKKKNARSIATLTSFLQKNELPIVAVWSSLPFVPTDVMCYVCGTLGVDIKKLLLGVFIGEGVTCALYIFMGKDLLMFAINGLFKFL